MELENNLEKKEELHQYLEKRVKENFIESLQNYVDQLKKTVNCQDIILQEHITIDRIEENIAICELADGSMIEIAKKDFPYEIKQGDVIKIEFCYQQGKQTEMKLLEKDEQEKLRRIELVKEKMNQIKNNLP